MLLEVELPVGVAPTTAPPLFSKAVSVACEELSVELTASLVFNGVVVLHTTWPCKQGVGDAAGSSLSAVSSDGGVATCCCCCCAEAPWRRAFLKWLLLVFPDCCWLGKIYEFVISPRLLMFRSTKNSRILCIMASVTLKVSIMLRSILVLCLYNSCVCCSRHTSS